MVKETLKLFWRVTWKYKRWLIWSEIGSILFVLSAEIAAPWLVSRVIDGLSKASATHQLNFQAFVPLLWAYIALRVVHVGSSRLTMQNYIRLEPSAMKDLQDLSYAKLQTHSMGFFADNFGGALVAKVNRLAAAYQRLIEVALGEFGMLIIRYVAMLIIIAIINVPIAIVFFLWTALFAVSLVYLHRRKMPVAEAAAAAQTHVTARLADLIANTTTIRSFARTKFERQRFEHLTQTQRDLKLRSYILSDRIRAYKSVTIFVLNILVLIMSIHYGLSGSLGIGSIVLIQLYLSQLVMQLWNLGRFMDRFEESLADASEMTEILLLPNEVVDPLMPKKSQIEAGEIVFEKVTFAYASNQKSEALLEDLSLQIPAGQKVGLVGPSGGGKTTLTKLLLRFMDIQAGAILIDGQNIREITQEDLRRSIAYVPQEPLLFHRTIFENIGYGNPAATKQQVLNAAKQAHAHEFISQMPLGYNTVVGERGVKLSGGQRQRVAIARALLKDAPILVLDEATSSLDSVSERYITEAMGALMRSRTTIVVAHRLSTIRRLDRILVIQGGQVVEDGTHTDLLALEGLYAQLWSHQTGDLMEEMS